MTTIFKGDNTASFGNSFITINLRMPEGVENSFISKAKFRVGNLPVMTFENPQFPLTVNLTSAQTSQLQQQNTCYLAVYDSEGRKVTCRGNLKFVARDAVVS